MSKIFGTNSVFEALNLNRVKKVYLLENYSNEKILNVVKQKHLPVFYCNRHELDNMVKGNHQGVIAECKNLEPISFESLMQKTKNIELPVLIILDGLKDPHNLGSILRSADLFNAQGVIYKNRNSVSLDETVEKISTGAANYVPCCEVSNISNTINQLKKLGYWIVGFDGLAKQDLVSIPKDVKLAIVIGSEGSGISRLVKENCDILLKIPMSGHGHIDSLNASVACSIALYEIRRQTLLDLDLLISLAKNGDIEAQKFLLNNCKDISVPISYKYLSKAVMQGIAFEEIRELVFPAFLKALNTYRKEGILFYDYFKYLYLMEIKTAIRNRVKTNMHEIHFENIDPDSDYGNIIFHAPNFNNLIDSYSDYDKDEIYDLVIKKKVPNITEKEYKILLLFLEGLNMMEISHSIARDYSETVKSFKKAINKIKAYFRVK